MVSEGSCNSSLSGVKVSGTAVQLVEKSGSRVWDVVFSQNGPGRYFRERGLSIFVDFQMREASATCCGVNLAAPAVGVPLLYFRML
jgi:hypothetical protein